MKTHGICHAQSARKHRKAGHLVQELGDGRRYQWMRCGPPGAVYPQMFGRAKRLNGTKPTQFIVDELPHLTTREDVERMARKSMINDTFAPIHTPVRCGIDPGAPEGDMAAFSINGPAKAFKLDGYYRVAVGEEWYPKRRNQHSKPLRIVAITNGGLIKYDRGEGGPGQWIEYTQFCGLIGKRSNL